MSFSTFTTGPFSTNSYLYEVSNHEAILIDAPPESFAEILPVLKEKNLTLSHLLLTHSHWDHTADVSVFKNTFPDLKVGIHLLDYKNLTHPGSDGLPTFIQISPASADIFFKEGDNVGPFEVLETPGHTPGGVVFYAANEALLFSGDTLFRGTIGNLSFPTARPELMWNSLKKLATLPEKVKVLPGHGEPTTIGAERWLSSAEDVFGN